MPGVSRETIDSAGGPLIATVTTVKVNNQSIIVQGDPVTSHGSSPHNAAVMVGASGTVKAGGKFVCRQGDAASCTHTASGSGDVIAG